MTRSIAIAAVAALAVSAAPAAAKPKLSVKTAQAKVVKHFTSAYDDGTYKATCKRARSGRSASCVLVRTAGTGPACARGTAKLNRRGRVVASSWPLLDCSGIPGAPPDDGAPAAAPPAPAADAGGSPPPGAPAPPAPAPAAPPASLPNPNGYAKNQICQTDSEAAYRAAGFTCQASGTETCIEMAFGGTMCVPVYVLFPLNADGTVGSRR